MKRVQVLSVTCAILILVAAIPSSGQNFTADARLVAMGGLGSHGNDSMKAAGNVRNYRSIGLPIGLIQVFKNTNVFRPDTDEFDMLRAIELIASPLHYTVDRTKAGPGNQLVTDIVKGRISRDLNQYRGFALKPSFDSQGLISPSFGKTIRVKGEKHGPNQGFYVGVGPYVHLATAVGVDQKLVNIFNSAQNTYLPNDRFIVTNTTTGQAAAAITFGYRGRFALAGMTTGQEGDRDGIYVSMNYNHLKGFRREQATTQVNFDTDAQGLITFQPTTTPFTLNHSWSEDGTGRAIDLGGSVISGHWEVNMGISGIGNKIDWSDHSAESFTLSSLIQGLDFRQTALPNPTGTQTIKVPVQYEGGTAYNTDRWMASAQFSHGLKDFEFRSGAEYRLSILEFRGGAHYRSDQWQPAAGIGLNITKGFGVDWAVYRNTTNVEEKSKPTFALSLRLGGTNLRN